MFEKRPFKRLPPVNVYWFNRYDAAGKITGRRLPRRKAFNRYGIPSAQSALYSRSTSLADRRRLYHASAMRAYNKRFYLRLRCHRRYWSAQQ